MEDSQYSIGRGRQGLEVQETGEEGRGLQYVSNVVQKNDSQCQERKRGVRGWWASIRLCEE